jgi:hypothetical protein
MRLRLFLCFVALATSFTPATSRAALTIAGIDGISSTVMQEGQSSFSGLALRTRIKTDRLIEGFSFMPTIEWWRASSNVQPFDIRSSRTDGTLGVDMRYDFKSTSVRPFVGAGYGVHFLSTKVDAPSLGLNNATDSVIKGGLALLGGISFGLTTHVDNFVELKYHHIPGYWQLKLNWGLAYNF